MSEKMSVSEAIASRASVRAFLDTPVAEETVVSILERARWAPSGGNLQPWLVHVLMDGARDRLVATVQERMQQTPMGEGPEYSIYPPKLKEPYRTRRFDCGEALYGSIGIPREDKMGRMVQFARNFEFFGAPVGLMISVDRQMGSDQWSDIGMFMQSVALLAREEGLDTCLQEAWAVWPKTVGEFLGLPEEHMLFCGIALGHADTEAPINNWRTERAELAEFATILRE